MIHAVPLKLYFKQCLLIALSQQTQKKFANLTYNCAKIGAFSQIFFIFLLSHRGCLRIEDERMAASVWWLLPTLCVTSDEETKSEMCSSILKEIMNHNFKYNNGNSNRKKNRMKLTHFYWPNINFSNQSFTFN